MSNMIWPLALCLAMASAWADDDEHHERHDKRRPRQLSSAGAPAVWKTECGSCHMAYPAGLLPGAAWRQQLDTLRQHYGVNATLDATDMQVIRDYLLRASASNTLPTPASTADEPPRITRTAWFIRKHDEVAPAVWRRASVKSASNCMACHRDAERGDFDDDRVRIPR